MSRPIAPGATSSPSPLPIHDKTLTRAPVVSHVDRSRVDPELVEAAQGMETMFLNYMMETMRKTVPDNEMNLENPATKIYRSMLDQEYSQIAAKTGGVGLADQIIAYVESTRYNQNREPRGIQDGSEVISRRKNESQQPKHVGQPRSPGVGALPTSESD